MGQGKSKFSAIVITVSDTRGEADDVSGRVVTELLASIGIDVAERRFSSDDLGELREKIYSAATTADIDLVITTGGTGFAPRDNTPEATRAVIEREAPGLAEAMRMQSFQQTPFSVLSRAVCGIRGRVLIINLPGSPKGAAECLETLKPVLHHALEILSGTTGH